MDKDVLVLAYLGDAVYEQAIRYYLVTKNNYKVKQFQKEAIQYVSASAQNKILNRLLAINFFNETELSIIYRARNHKSNHHPKNTDIITYKHATALEAVIGYLKITNQEERFEQLMAEVYEKIE